MSLDKLILLLIQLSKRIKGKTLLQKRVYFLSILLRKNFGFRAHHYGPYSPFVEDSLGKMKSLDFIKVSANNYGTDNIGFEVCRYDYGLTDDGKILVDNYEKNNPDEYKKIKKQFQLMKDSGDIDDYISLSIAAKIHYIIDKSQSKSRMSVSEIRERAKQLGWNIKDEKKIDKAIVFLQELKLIETEESNQVN